MVRPVKQVGLEDALRLGVALFNDGRFFEAHEAWEDAWRVERGDTALFLQGLIQVAAGFVKWQRGEPRGMTLNLAKGAAKLERFRPAHLGLDVADLLDAVARFREGGAAARGAAPPRLKGLQI
ncbi:MAG: DUF309 domain-containing protein [Candidatus Polarisedimenticolia bacterium]